MSETRIRGRITWMMRISALLKLSLVAAAGILIIRFCYLLVTNWFGWTAEVKAAGVWALGSTLAIFGIPPLTRADPPMRRWAALGLFLLGVNLMLKEAGDPFPKHRALLPVAWLATSAFLFWYGDYPPQTEEEKLADPPPGLFKGILCMATAWILFEVISTGGHQ